MLKPLAIAFGLLVLGGGVLVLFAPGGVVDHVPIWSWSRGGESPWPRIEHQELSVSLTPPGGFSASGRLHLSGIEGDRVRLLLNSDLELDAARWGERELRFGHGFSLRGRYHSEGRVVHVRLPEAPPDGRAVLDLSWSGRGEHGRDGSDWRGILMIDLIEARMCEQTVFVPQVPLSTAGPAVQTSPFSLRVEAPAVWEVVSSTGASGPPEDLPGERRAWSFASAGPAHPAVMAGAWARADVVHRGAALTSLMRAEHAHLSQPLLASATGAVDALSAALGPAVEGGSLAIVEQDCRPSSSYNWTTDGLIVLDRNALSGRIPHATVAHEVGHLWWGGAVEFDGPGERFLTEGGAEAASWLALGAQGLALEQARALADARRDLGKLLDQGRSLPLAEVGFGSPRYTELAYAKGGLVQRWVAGMLGPEGLAELCAELRELGAAGPVSLAQWRAAVARVGDGLSVPWLDHGGDLALSLHDVELAPGGGAVSGRVALERRGGGGDDGGDMPLRLRAVVEVQGRGFIQRERLELDGDTPFRVDLSAHPGAVVQALRLDPDGLMPLVASGGEVVLDGAALLHSDPVQDAADVPVGLTELTLSFDRPLTPVTLERWRAERPDLPEGVRAPSVVALDFEQDGHLLRVTTRPLSPDTTWLLPLRGALRDRFGGPPIDEHLRFATGASDDEQPPRIVSVVPPSGSLVSPDLRSIVITWNEPMRAGTGFKTDDCDDLADDGYALPEMDFGQWDASGTVLTIPLEQLEPGTSYGLPVGRAYRDLSGNAAEREDITFTTGP